LGLSIQTNYWPFEINPNRFKVCCLGVATFLISEIDDVIALPGGQAMMSAMRG
jgi:hypothetical protein